MVSKDQVIGVLIFIVCLAVAAGYFIVVVFPQSVAGLFNLDASEVRFWAIAIVVLIAFLVVMLIGAWIGWTMATTPPPKPIEEIEKTLEETGEAKEGEQH
jgi:predicted DNA-binding transcriptional regulator